VSVTDPTEVEGLRARLAAQTEELERLRDAEARYLDLYDNAPDMFVSVDAETGHVVQCNRTLLEATGFSREQVIGRPIFDRYHPDSVPGAQAAFERFVATGEIVDAELQLIRADGSPLDVSLNVTSVRDEAGNVVRSRSSWRDITDRKRLQARARASEERYHALFDTMPVGWANHQVVYDADGTPTDYVFLEANEAFERFTGLGLDGIRGRRVTEVIPGVRDADPDLVTVYGEVGTTGVEYSSEIFFAPFDKWYQVTAFSRQVGFFSVMFEDITQRKRSEQQVAEVLAELERSNAELQQFAYVASHDLQEPLRMVASYTELLARRYKGALDDKADKYIHYAVDGAKRMQGLINDLLAYSRVGTQVAPFEPIDCRGLVESVQRSLQMSIAEAGAVLEVGSLPTVLGDRSQLGQVFQNLVGNAVKFRGEETPQVRVSAERDGDAWSFCVQDNGIGIDLAYVDRIFEVFQRLHGRADYPGSGIGLAIVKKIIERHGGTIRVESEPGQGSRFLFRLPAQGEGIAT
jgi:PAS domain S-box-containing protein